MYSVHVTIAKTYPAMNTLKLLLAPCFCIVFFFQSANENSKQSGLQVFVNWNIFSYQLLSWKLDKSISSSLSRKPRNILNHPCPKPLSHFFISCVVTLIGRNDKVTEVKHQYRFLSYLAVTWRKIATTKKSIFVINIFFSRPPYLCIWQISTLRNQSFNISSKHHPFRRLRLAIKEWHTVNLRWC